MSREVNHFYIKFMIGHTDGHKAASLDLFPLCAYLSRHPKLSLQRREARLS